MISICKSTRYGLVATLALLLAPSLALADSDEQKGKAPLVLPSNPPDADAKGKVEIKSDSETEKFKVKAENVDGMLNFEVFLEDALDSGNLVSIGTMLADDEDAGEFELKFESDQGPLPFGVTQVSDLSGRDLEVRSGGQAFLLGTVPAMGEGGEGKGKAPLQRPSNPPDADAKGKVEIKQEGSRDKFKVKAERVDSLLTFEVFLEDGPSSGNLVSIGTMLPDDEDADELELKFESDQGPLPFDVPQVGDLSGRRLEVRSSGQVYLLGVVPEIGTGDSGESKWQKGKTYLTRPPAEPDDDAKGKLEIRSRAKDTRQRFQVKAERLSPGSYSVFLEDALDSGNLVSIGALSQDGEDQDEYELKLDTSSGDPLPFGVLDVADLVGRDLEVRDGSGTIYLIGVVPALGTSGGGGGGGGKSEAKSKLTGSTGKGEIEVESNPRKGKEELEIKLKRQTPNSSVELFVEDPANNTLTLVATLSTSDSGKAKYKVKTANGTSLPFGVASVGDLGGMAVEIREPGTGTVLLSGTMPTLTP